MNKWYGKVGYVTSTEVEPGIYDDTETTYEYYGEWIKKSSRFRVSDTVTDNTDVSAELSIMADSYAELHFHSIRFVEFGGVKWKVNTVEPRRPRLILSIGGVYNG